MEKKKMPKELKLEIRMVKKTHGKEIPLWEIQSMVNRYFDFRKEISRSFNI